MDGIGRHRWAMAQSCISIWSHGSDPEMTSEEPIGLFAAGTGNARAASPVCCADHRPAGRCFGLIPAGRTRHIRFHHLIEQAPLPRGASCACIVVSGEPIVCQHTRLTSRQAETR